MNLDRCQFVVELLEGDPKNYANLCHCLVRSSLSSFKVQYTPWIPLSSNHAIKWNRGSEFVYNNLWLTWWLLDEVFIYGMETYLKMRELWNGPRPTKMSSCRWFVVLPFPSSSSKKTYIAFHPLNHLLLLNYYHRPRELDLKLMCGAM